MPWVNPLDPTTPTDANWVFEGDDRIREIKAALNERMLSLISNWPDGEPLEFVDSMIPHRFSSGTLAARPNPPEKEELVYFALDTDQWFVSKETAPDTFEWQESKKTTIVDPAITVVSAGESRFAPEGNETAATRVKNAIITAKLSSSQVKVVFVPRSMWGYVANSDYSSSMYDQEVLLVREGGIVGWYDPIAYGADPTGTTNSRNVINTCFIHAANTGGGMQVVAFTLPGNYLMTTDVDRLGCGVFMMPGVNLTGGGELTGMPAWTFDGLGFAEYGDEADLPATGTRIGHEYQSVDTGKRRVWTGAEWTLLNPDPFTAEAFVEYNADAGAGTRATAGSFEKMLYLRLRGTANGSGELDVSFAEAGMAGYDINKLVYLMAVEVERVGTTGAVGGAWQAKIDAANSRVRISDLGAGQVSEIGLLMGFAP